MTSESSALWLPRRRSLSFRCSSDEDTAPSPKARKSDRSDRLETDGWTYTRAELEALLRVPLRGGEDGGLLEDFTSQNSDDFDKPSPARNAIFRNLGSCITFVTCLGVMLWLVKPLMELMMQFGIETVCNWNKDREPTLSPVYRQAQEQANIRETDSKPIAWCTSGGGIRALSSAIGFAHTFQKAQLFNNSALKTVSCNSGGCWFMTLFSYSADFYEKVTSERDEEVSAFVCTLVSGIDALVGTGEKLTPDTIAGLTSKCAVKDSQTPARRLTLQGHTKVLMEGCKLVRRLFNFRGNNKKLASVCEATSRFGLKWQTFIKELLSSMDDIARHNNKSLGSETNSILPVGEFRSLHANASNRQGLTRPSLLLQTANTTSSWVYNVDFELWTLLGNPLLSNAYKLNKDGLFDVGYHIHPVVPLQWYVPGEDFADENASFMVPSSIPSYIASKVGLPSFIHIFSRRWHPLEINEWHFFNWTRLQNVTEPWDGRPLVVEVAAASSSAAGMFGSPQMMNATANWACGTFKAFVMEIMPNGLQGLAVCGGKLKKTGLQSHRTEENGEEKDEAGGECTFPLQTLVDGGFVDNMATAQTVAFMQQKYPGETLRFILTDAAQNTSGESAEQKYEWDSDVIDISDLMNSAQYYSGNFSSPIIDGTYLGIPRPNPHVFDCNFSSLVWPQVEVNMGAAEGEHIGFNLLWTNTSARTIRNDHFGVKEGTPVELLIFVSVTNLTAFELGEGIEKKHATFVRAIASSNASSILEEWLKRTGSKTSE